MLNKEIAISAIGLSMMAASKGLAIVPVTGTPMDSLTSLSNPAGMVDAVIEGQATPELLIKRAEVLELGTQSADGIQSPHDQAMDSYVNDISVAIKNHISTAKNIVAPRVIAFGEALVTGMGQPISPAGEFCIEVVDLPSPMQSSSFEANIEKFEGKKVMEPDAIIKLNEITIEEMRDLMLTGSKDFDACVCEWVASKEPNFFMNIWGNLFRDIRDSKPTITASLEEMVKDSVTGPDTALTVYLLARRMFDEPPAGTNMTLEVFKNIAAQYRDSAGAALYSVYQRFNISLKTGSLVLMIANQRKTVRVNGPVYREWLKTGGSNEMLLGMLTTNESVYSDQLINTKKEAFLAAWVQYETFANLAAKNNTFNRFISIASMQFDISLRDTSEEEKQLFGENPNMISNIQNYFKEELAKVTNADLTDYNELALRLVCRSRYYYTSAEKILRGINEAIKANPKCDIRSAALLSAIEYMSDFVADQIVLV